MSKTPSSTKNHLFPNVNSVKVHPWPGWMRAHGMRWFLELGLSYLADWCYRIPHHLPWPGLLSLFIIQRGPRSKLISTVVLFSVIQRSKYLFLQALPINVRCQSSTKFRCRDPDPCRIRGERNRKRERQRISKKEVTLKEREKERKERENKRMIKTVDLWAQCSHSCHVSYY